MVLWFVLKRNALITSILTYLIFDVFVYGSVGIDGVILKKEIYTQNNGACYISLLGSTVANWAAFSSSVIEIYCLTGRLFFSAAC